MPIRPLLLSFLLGLGALARPAEAPSPALLRAADDFSRVANRVNPWVVNINTTQYVRQRLNPFWLEFYGFDPFAGGRTFRRQSLGSGFIYSADGLILTNAHVVSGADEILVRLMDGTEAPATVVGEDSGVDLALLKIEAPRRLPTAVLGDSDKVKVGEWAIAIGSPLGFDHTLTVGVVSAKGRTNIFSGQGAAKYQNYIQTDASINHGNSGGPLCNIRGEVIGMNTAISTPNEGNIGIGFAIPVNFIKRSIPDLQRAGRVLTPDLGFFTQDVDARLAEALKLPAKSGVLVTDVVSRGAAERAGLRRGDVILAANGQAVANGLALRARIYEAEPGQALRLRVWREGRALDLSVAPEQRQNAGPGGWRGLRVVGNNRSVAAQRGLALPEGVVVTAVAPGSPAERIGIEPGDVLLQLNQTRLDLEAWNRLTGRMNPSQEAVLLLLRGRQSAYVVLPAEP